MNRGVVYYNTGTRCLVRLLVSICSLRNFYSGPVTILLEGDDSLGICSRIGTATNADIQAWSSGIPDGKNRHLLAKTRYCSGSPYDTTVAIDSDTLVVGAIDELFHLAEESEFCVAQFANWRSNDGLVGKRIREWQGIHPLDIEHALDFGPAINCGVIAFKKRAAFCQDWRRLALPGRELFIPDEVSCQVTLHRYPHRIVDQRWNRSCKYDNPDKPDTRIIHYHGEKHCRPGLPFHGGKWLQELEAAYEQNVASLKEWIPAGDHTLDRFRRVAAQSDGF
jgi:hypothetical protein